MGTAGESRRASRSHNDIWRREVLAQIGGEQTQPGRLSKLEIGLTCLLPLLWQHRVLCETAKCFRIGSDHQTQNFVGPLLIKAMLTVEGWRNTHSCVTLGGEHEAFGGVDQYTVGKIAADVKISADVEESKSGKDVNCIFLAAEHGQAEVTHQRVAEFMSQREESVSNYKLDNPFPLVRVKGRG